VGTSLESGRIEVSKRVAARLMYWTSQRNSCLRSLCCMWRHIHRLDQPAAADLRTALPLTAEAIRYALI